MKTTTTPPTPTTPTQPTSPVLTRGGEQSLTSTPARDDEEGRANFKTIPFLRQLTEMLLNNEDLISFVPGQRLPDGKIIHGKITVHDRNRVQSEVLPIYFNHASFASLRRQLSYFSFVRVGKSRQCGVSYINESVVVMEDILKLKRRTSGPTGGILSGQKKQPPHYHGRESGKVEGGESQLADNPKDVASAVLSGTLRAAKTNQSLDSDNSGTGNNRTNNVCQTNGSARQSSHSQSLSTSSSLAPQTGGSAVQSSLSRSISSSSSLQSSPAVLKKPKSRKNRIKKRPQLIPKYKLTRKDRKRLAKMLSANNIVPFIHLPNGRACKRKPRSESRREKRRGDRPQKENVTKNTASGQRASGSISAVNALLALRANQS